MKTNKRDKMRRVLCLVLALVLLGSLISGAMIVMVNAKSSSELKAELAELRNEQAEIQKQTDALEKSISENKSKTKSIVEQKADVDHQMEMSRQMIENLKAQVQQYSLLIAEKQKELESSIEREATLQSQYETRVRSMEETGKVSYWSILFQAKSFSDLLDRIDMIQEIANSDRLMLKQLSEASAAVEAEREELEVQKADLEIAEKELSDQQTELESQREEANKLIAQMQIEYANLSEEFQKAEEAEEELRKQIKARETDYFNALKKEEAARIAEQNRQNNNKVPANSAGATSTGGFMFPLAASNGVSSAYGPRVHPINGNKTFHSGVDLRADMNAVIYATKSGTVTFSGYGEANGFYVTVNHGDGFSSLYAHMVSNEVSVGDYVTQGQRIGIVGMSGWSTGPHLHFEIYVNGSTVNPMNYISG